LEGERLLQSLFFFRNFYKPYNREVKTKRPKPKGMVERVARSWRLIGSGHHDLETDLKNESGNTQNKKL